MLEVRQPGGRGRESLWRAWRATVRIEVNGVSLAVGEAGSGVPLLLVHGFPLSSQMWEPVLPPLAEAARVITVDLRGFGDSQAPADGYTMDRLAADVMAVADVMGVDRFVLAGHSMGGYVAFRVAARGPDRLAALVLVDSRAEADDEAGRRRREEAITRIVGGGRENFLDDFIPNLVAPDTRRRSPRLLDELRAMAQGVPDRVLAGCLAGMRDRPDSRELLPTLTVPVLVMVGEDVAITPPASAQAMADAVGRAQLAIIPGAGHTPPMERPVAAAEVMVAFLRTMVPHIPI